MKTLLFRTFLALACSLGLNGPVLAQPSVATGSADAAALPPIPPREPAPGDASQWRRLVLKNGIQVLLPNSAVWGNPIVNYSRNSTRRLDMLLGVRHDDDLETALGVLRDLVARQADVLPDPAPEVMVMEYRDSAVMLNIRLWTLADKYWDVRFDLHRRAPQALRQAGLRSPIPLREVRTVDAPAASDS